MEEIATLNYGHGAPWEDKEKVNSELATLDIHGKDYIEVSERIKGFWKLFPNGRIETKLIDCADDYCVFKAEIYNQNILMATGYAREIRTSKGINSISFIENCETSAVGRAIGMLGIGLTNGIASADEVKNAEDNQLIPLTKEQLEFLTKNADKLVDQFKAHNIKYASELKALSMEEASEIIGSLND